MLTPITGPQYSAFAAATTAQTSRASGATVTNLVTLVDGTAKANGARANRIDFSAVGTIVDSIIGLWLFDGTNWNLLKDIQVVAGTAPDNTIPAWSYAWTIPIGLTKTQKLGFTTHHTQTINALAQVGDNS